MVQYIINGNRAEQAARLVAHRHADHVVGGEPGGQLALGQLGSDEDARLDTVTDLGGGRAAQQPLETCTAVVTGMSGSLIRASTSATDMSGVTMSGWEVIRPPAVVAS